MVDVRDEDGPEFDPVTAGLGLVMVQMKPESVDAYGLLPESAYFTPEGALALLQRPNEETIAFAMEQTIELLRPRGPSAPLAASLLALARCLPRWGHEERVLQVLLEALDVARSIGDRMTEGRALVLLGTSLRDSELALDALHAFELASPLLEEQSDTGGLAALHYNRGALCRQVGLIEEAIRELQDAQRLLTPRNPMGTWEAQVWSELLNAFAQLGDDDAVARGCDDWLARVAEDDKPPSPDFMLSPILHRARVARRRGDDTAARVGFSQVAEIAYRSAMQLTTQAFRSTHRERIQPAFEEGLGFAIGTNDPELAVTIFERSRTVGSEATAGRPDLTDEDVAARLHSLRDAGAALAITSTNAVMLGDPFDQHRCEVEATWLVAQREQLVAGNGSTADTTPDEDIIGAARGRLGPETLVLEFASVRGLLVALVIGSESLALAPARITAGEAALTLTAAHREAQALLPTHALDRLGEALLARVSDRLDSVRRLALVLPRELSGLPVSALAPHAEAPALVDSHDVVEIPSLSLLPEEHAAAARLDPSDDCTVLYVSSPRYEVVDELPGGAEEVAMIRERFPNANVIEGDAATVEQLLSAGERGGIVHVVCHAFFEQRGPLMSRLLLADRPVFAFEVLLATMRARLVNLSGCRTATARVGAGGDAQGLASAFVAAGAEAVLGAIWPIPDADVSAFNAAFYDAALASSGTIGSWLGAAQRRIREDEQTRHPYFWAPFVALEGARS